MIGQTYLLRGEPVTVLVRWSGRGPRNVWIRRADGTEDIRPFRGLRKTSAGNAASPLGSAALSDGTTRGQSQAAPAAPVPTPPQGR